MVFSSLASLASLAVLALLEGGLRPAAYKLWSAADFGFTPRECAAWIVSDEVAAPRWVAWGDSRRFRAAKWIGPSPAGAVAIVHTHPDMVDPKPSEQDVETARNIGMPVYTISRTGIWKAVPDGSVVRLEGAGWWADCRAGRCAESRPLDAREARQAHAVPIPEVLRNLGIASAYP